MTSSFPQRKQGRRVSLLNIKNRELEKKEFLEMAHLVTNQEFVQSEGRAVQSVSVWKLALYSALF